MRNIFALYLTHCALFFILMLSPTCACAQSDSLNALLADYVRQYGVRSPQYADAVQWCAYQCLEHRDQKQSQRLLKASDRLFRNYGRGTFGGRDTISQIFMLDTRARLAEYTEADRQALKYAKRALRLKQQYFGEHDKRYFAALLELSRLHALRLNKKKSQRYHNKGYNAYVDMIKREFCSSSESERTLYWNTAIKYINQTIDLTYKTTSRFSTAQDNSMAISAYNALLLSKGLLLNTSVSFERHIMDSNNPTAIAGLLKRKSLVAAGASHTELDSLDYVILDALRAKGQEFTLPQLSLTWRDVAARLNPDDVAIEFYKTTTDNYGAIVLRHGWSAPRCVRLEEVVRIGRTTLPLHKAMQQVSLKRSKADSLWALGRAIWTDELVKHFPTTPQGRIFFAAEGALHITGIEYLPFIDPRKTAGASGEYSCVADLFDTYRLSSTRQIATVAEAVHGRGATVYGGLRYDLDVASMEANQRQYPDVLSPQHYLALNMTDMEWDEDGDEGTRGRVAERITPLPWAKIEADSVVSILNSSRQGSMDARPYTSEAGTEASLKALSGKRTRLLHLATHGYYLKPSQAKGQDLARNPLLRSCLLMAGADNSISGGGVPKGVDDGILSAQEIAVLDLQGMDLVTLSACQTALGDVDSDGVFGLQRGFKMAGAGTLLMSLWKVDDQVTQAFMICFYHNLTSGMSKHAAFEGARRHVRDNWPDVRHWPVFIMLDGIE